MVLSHEVKYQGWQDHQAWLPEQYRERRRATGGLARRRKSQLHSQNCPHTHGQRPAGLYPRAAVVPMSRARRARIASGLVVKIFRIQGLGSGHEATMANGLGSESLRIKPRGAANRGAGG